MESGSIPCPACGVPVPLPTVDVPTAVTCSACGAALAPAAATQRSPILPLAGAPLRPREEPMVDVLPPTGAMGVATLPPAPTRSRSPPVGIVPRVESTPTSTATAEGSLVLESRWLGPNWAVLGSVSAAAVGLLPGPIGAVAYLAYLRSLWIVPIGVGATIYVAATLAVTYTAAAFLLNASRVRVDPTGIVLDHRPLPWPGAERIPAVQVRRLFVAERLEPGPDGERTVYDVSALLHTTREVVLARNLRLLADARRAERAIANEIGLADPMPGAPEVHTVSPSPAVVRPS